MRITLERITNVVVIASCLFVVGDILYHRVDSPKAPPVYAAGSRIKDVPALGLKNAERTIILATSSSCHFCVASLPFYRRLAIAAKHGGTRIVAVTPELPPANRAFLESNDVPIDASLSIPQSGVSVQQTPTLILVRRDGTVINSWLGQLSAEKEGQILRMAAGS
jgi:hypothetical protein